MAGEKVVISGVASESPSQASRLDMTLLSQPRHWVRRRNRLTHLASSDGRSGRGGTARAPMLERGADQRRMSGKRSSRSGAGGSIPCGPGSTGIGPSRGSDLTTSRRWTCCSSSPRSNSSNSSPGLHDSAPPGSERSITVFPVCVAGGQAIASPNPSGSLSRSTGSRAATSPSMPRLASVRSAARSFRDGIYGASRTSSTGEPDLDPEPRILFCPHSVATIPRLAAEQDGTTKR